MADIFISYSNQDQDKARLLAAYLEAQGYSVWWDQSLLSGDNFRKIIMTELSRAKAAIVIWTENSISSDWVQSEAGRAHADGKLIPVKEALLEYTDIPPPFDNMHTEFLRKPEHIEAAVIAQLSKPQSTPPLWKVARYQLFSWCGIIGAALSLFTNLGSFLKLADWANWLASHWIELAERFWGYVLQWIGISLPNVLIHDLNFMVFVVMTAIGSKLAFFALTNDVSTPVFDYRILFRWNILLAGPVYVASRFLILEIMSRAFWPNGTSEPTVDYFYFNATTNVVPALIFTFFLVFHWPLRAILQTLILGGTIFAIYLFGLHQRADLYLSEGLALIEIIMVVTGGIIAILFASSSHIPRRLWAIIVVLLLLAIGNEISKLDFALLAPVS